MSYKRKMIIICATRCGDLIKNRYSNHGIECGSDERSMKAHASDDGSWWLVDDAMDANEK